MIDLIGRVPAYAAKTFGDKTALIFEDRAFSYNELNELVERAASGLVRLGVSREDIVTLYASNSWQYVVSYYAAYRLGAVVNPVNAMLLPHDVEHIVTDCDAQLIIASSNVVSGIVCLKDRTDVAQIVSIGENAPDGTLPFATLIDHDLPSVAPVSGDRDDLSTICYTSGTTGKPKGVMQSHHAVLLNSAMISQMHHLGPDDCNVTALPLPHVFSNVLMNAMMLRGMKTVLHASFDPGAILADMEKHKATVVYAVPPMFLAMLNHPDMATTDLSSLRFGLTGAAPLPEAAIAPVEAAFGINLTIGWGMTELAGGGSMVPVLGDIPFGSAGVAYPYCQMKVVDPADAETELPRGEPGELMFKGPVVMMGYLNNEAATREILRADGWMHTGDIATLDHNGCVTLIDRKKDMMIVGGSNVYPAEVEQVLAVHPAVAQVAVGPQVHDTMGQVPKAYVMLKGGADIIEADLVTFCKERLAPFKCARTVQFVEDLPRNPTGKILRRNLKDLDLVGA